MADQGGKRGKRIGLTMRGAPAASYVEPRDAVSRAWFDFMQFCLPDAQWMLIPNLGAAVIDYVRAFELDGCILSGGNDLGEDPRRDETEGALVDWAVREARPLFGVCRGLQLLQAHFGGALASCDPAIHVAREHAIEYVRGVGSAAVAGTREMVNSYHDHAVALRALAAELEPVALSADGLVEAVVHRALPLLAVQWHPERAQPFSARDRALLRGHFGLPEAPCAG